MFALVHLFVAAVGAFRLTAASNPAVRQPQQCVQRTSLPLMVAVGDQIVAGNDWNSSSPAYGIVRAQTYELQRVYYQGIVDGGRVERVDVNSLEESAPDGCSGYRKYVVLYSPRYHEQSGPVVVTESEVALVTIRDELTDSAWLALPGLFWVWLAWTFYQYGESKGFIF